MSRRLHVEPLEPRLLLSADLKNLTLYPAADADRSPTATPAADVAGAAWGRLYSVAWAGSGQVKMKQQGAWWADDTYTDRGDRDTATGKSKPSWADYNGDGDAGEWNEPWDPVAYLRNSKPSLTVVFSVNPAYVKSIQIQAVSVDGGRPLVFSGSGRVSKALASVSLVTPNTVGSTIDNRDVQLEWFVSVNGGGWEDLGSSVQRLFVLYNKPLDTSSNSPTAARVWYACHLAYGESTPMAMAQDIANDAQSRFDTDYFYLKEAAWQVLDTGGDCGADSWLMHNALAVIGVAAEVRYVYPRHASWSKLYSTSPGKNERLGNATLIYVDANGNGNNYEGCCFVSDGTSTRYYLGGYGGDWQPTAYAVLMAVSGPNTSGAGAHQCWTNAWYTPVSYPAGVPRASAAAASAAEADWRSLLLADSSLLRQRVVAPAEVAALAGTASRASGSLSGSDSSSAVVTSDLNRRGSLAAPVVDQWMAGYGAYVTA